jgi:hypothetical protein
METLERLEKLVVKKFEELQTYTKLFNSQALTHRLDTMTKAKAQYKKDPDSVEVNELAKNLFYVQGFNQTDIRQLQITLLEAYNLYRELDGASEFTPDIIATINLLKSSFPQPIFTVENGAFVELVSGRLEGLLKDYEEKNYFKIFEAQLIKLLDE